jgi:ribosomal protein L37AE/L43A
MQCLRHVELFNKLKRKCEEEGIAFVEVHERWTSKTCTYCGRIDYKLYGKKVYKCQHCNAEYDRDMGAARNIFLANFHFLEREINLHISSSSSTSTSSNPLSGNMLPIVNGI